MSKHDQIADHDVYASTYDSQVKEYNSYGHDALFGMCYEFIQPNESLLDLGIGTGLSSLLFSKAGLSITGLDGSKAMLEECLKKGFTRDLKQYDIQDTPLPFSDRSFDHAICCGVFHFFGGLCAIFQEVQRLLKAEGIFAFTVSSPTSKEISSNLGHSPEYFKIPTKWGIPIYKHTNEYILKLAEDFGFVILKEQKLQVFSGDKKSEDLLFKIFVCGKKDSSV